MAHATTKRAVDDRGAPCSIAQRPPVVGKEEAAFSSMKRPFITFLPGILLACTVAITWVLVIDPLIAQWFHFKTGVIGATAVALITNVTVELRMMSRFYSLRWAGFTRVYLEAGQCPSCGYGLLGVPADTGFVRCPECNAAWCMDRIGTGAAHEPAQ